MKDTWFKTFKLGRNKSVELETTKVNIGFDIYEHNRIHSRRIYFETNLCNIIGATFDWNWKSDHAGVHIDITLFGRIFGFSLYDVRHWNDVEDCWESYDEEE
jgi:hypothetical protein